MRRLGIYFWIRVGVMSITLVAVISTIYKLNNPGSYGLMDMIFGMQNPNRVKICPTQVTSVSVIGKAAMFQDELKWYRASASSGEREELDPVAVEMWFSKYCALTTEPTASTTSSITEPVVTFAYASGPPMTIKYDPSGIFAWGEKHFRSSKLTEALAEIAELPLVKKEH